MLWKTISNLPGCKPVTPPKKLPQLFLFQTSVDDTGWLVCPYKNLTKFATELRNEKLLFVQGENHDEDFTHARLNPMAQPVHVDETPPVNRKTDREENVKSFWESQTPQSHHIVEFNNLQTLGFSRKKGNEEMDYLQLPAVLLAVEFYQRYISAILKPTQKLEKDKLQSEIVPIYRKFYLGSGKLFEPLWTVSKVIFEQANLKT